MHFCIFLSQSVYSNRLYKIPVIHSQSLINGLITNPELSVSSPATL